ncbi:CoA transferase subunit alpha [Bacillus sp. TS-2]|nr:CoA transferase subunit alpha [Bacillus sp. TS-2]
MINKETTEKYIRGLFKHGQTIMVGGFGGIGNPPTLLKLLKQSSTSSLTMISNDAAFPDIGVGRLFSNNQVKQLITSHIGSNPLAGEKMLQGDLQVEFCPQGILMERIRAGGVGLPAFLSNIQYAEALNLEKEKIEIDDQVLYIEKALKADIALIYAKKSDRYGNLFYESTAINTAPVMAMAAAITIVEAEEILELGELQPNEIMTPGIFVNHVLLSKGVDWKWAWE